MDYPFPNLNSSVSGRFESDFTFWTWFDWLVADEVFLVKLHSNKCHWPSLMPSQRWLRWWLTTRHQATTWAKVDPDFCCHVAPLGKNEVAWKIHYGMEKIFFIMFTTAWHASMIGRNSKNVMGYDVRCKTCRVCDHASARKVPPRVHDCRKNWYGSAKAMEPSMVVEMIQKANEAVKIGAIIGDDDTTTIARVRAEVDESIKKCSDKIMCGNHCRMNCIKSKTSTSTNCL